MDLLVPVRETRSKDLPQYVLSLPFPLEDGDRSIHRNVVLC